MSINIKYFLIILAVGLTLEYEFDDYIKELDSHEIEKITEIFDFPVSQRLWLNALSAVIAILCYRKKKEIFYFLNF